MKLFRKRYIPNEIVDISGDEILSIDTDLIITKWKPIRPRDDIGSGLSFTFLNDGIKVSKFYDKNGNFLYWYCDIIDYSFNKEKHEYIFTDLLVDVKVYKDGKYEVLDLDELVEAYKKKLITIEIMTDALTKLNKLLFQIKVGDFPNDVCKNFGEETE